MNDEPCPCRQLTIFRRESNHDAITSMTSSGERLLLWSHVDLPVNLRTSLFIKSQHGFRGRVDDVPLRATTASLSDITAGLGRHRIHSSRGSTIPYLPLGSLPSYHQLSLLWLELVKEQNNIKDALAHGSDSPSNERWSSMGGDL